MDRYQQALLGADELTSITALTNVDIHLIDLSCSYYLANQLSKRILLLALIRRRRLVAFPAIFNGI